MRVIYSECSLPFWVDTASILYEEAGWKPVYWTGWVGFGIEKAVKDRFPDVVFHDSVVAAKGIAPQECRDLPLPPVDEALLRDLAFEESAALTMMDRMDPGGNFALHERKRLYYTYLRYWQGVIEHYKPDLLVMPIAPHLMFDYVLYILCLRKGVKTVMFERTGIAGQLFLMERLEEGSEAVRTLYTEKLAAGIEQPVELSEAGDKYLDRLAGRSYREALAPFTVKVRERTARPKGLKARLKYAYKILRRQFGPAPDNYLKQSNETIESSRMTSTEYWLYRHTSDRRKRQLARIYESLAREVDLAAPYIYVALSYQPERTTSPLGGVFVDQTLMIDLLSKTIPDGWQLYVKEHPRQFQPGSRGHMTRTGQFYRDIVALPNAKLVPMSMVPFDLIDQAKAVATVTTTTGFEGVARGKPAIIFGQTWYKGCEGVFYAPTVEKCAEAIAQIESGYQPRPEAIRLFVHTLEEVCMPGYVDPALADFSGLTPMENARAIAMALREWVSTGG
ncbi:MAG: hypothetical protein JXJ17_18080 [Anaerolineae bacterium]|nr:hypothetical protein [Anaerolineae bacterium]